MAVIFNDPDPFERRDPVQGRHFFGRRRELERLQAGLHQGRWGGVFGLRKVGKTSLVRALSGGESRFIWLDIQTLLRPTPEAVCRALLRAASRTLSTDESAGLPSSPPDDHQALVALLAAALNGGARLVLVLDEVDLLFRASGLEPRLLALFRDLDGLARGSGRLSLVTIGRDPADFMALSRRLAPAGTRSRFSPLWLGPLTKSDADAMLAELGQRSGLNVGPRSLALAWEWSGGLPLLHRQFGSALLEVSREHNAAPRRSDSYAEEAASRYLERDTVLETAREIWRLLDSRYPEAATLLADLAAGRAVSPDASGTRSLRRFGLLSPGFALPRLLSWYVAEVAPPRVRAGA